MKSTSHASTTSDNSDQSTEASPGQRLSQMSNQERLELLDICGYEVQPGDTLWDIAAKEYEGGQDWPELYGYNKEIIGDDPDYIQAGEVINLCSDIPINDTLLEEAAPEEVLPEEAPPCVIEVSKSLFPKLAGKDGYLSEADIERALTDSSLTLEESAALVTLRTLRAQLEECSNDEWLDENSGVTLADLEAYEQSGTWDHSTSEPEAWYSHHMSKMSQQSQEIFANDLPNVSALSQGGIGDCYFLAALGSIVEQNPQAIVDMVEPNQDGTFTITFPNGQSATVEPPTLAETSVYGSSGADGMWVTLFERAAGKLIDSDSESPAKELDGGSLNGRWGAKLFSTDGAVNTDMLSLTADDTTRERLTEAFEDGRAVVANIANFGKRQGLPTGHSYSVLSWNPETDTITIRNPWGSQEITNAKGRALDGVNDGTFQMKLEEFTKLFSSLSYSNASFEL